jgi:hypothetical protein
VKQKTFEKQREDLRKIGAKFGFGQSFTMKQFLQEETLKSMNLSVTRPWLLLHMYKTSFRQPGKGVYVISEKDIDDLKPLSPIADVKKRTVKVKAPKAPPADKPKVPGKSKAKKASKKSVAKNESKKTTAPADQKAE